MRHVKQNQGFSLIEVVVTIAFVGLISLGVYSSINTSIAMNARTQSLLKAELDVKQAVETLMATGIDPAKVKPIPGKTNEYIYDDHHDDDEDSPQINIIITLDDPVNFDKDDTPYYNIVFSEDYGTNRKGTVLSVTIQTKIKRATP